MQETIASLRKNATVDAAFCNLLENDANSLLAAIREARDWHTTELPNIDTLLSEVSDDPS